MPYISEYDHEVELSRLALDQVLRLVQLAAWKVEHPEVNVGNIIAGGYLPLPFVPAVRPEARRAVASGVGVLTYAGCLDNIGGQ